MTEERLAEVFDILRNPDRASGFEYDDAWDDLHKVSVENRDALVRGAYDADPSVRLFCLRALMRLSRDLSEYSAVFCDRIVDRDRQVRLQAMRSLLQKRACLAPDARRVLWTRARDPSAYVSERLLALIAVIFARSARKAGQE